MKKLIICNSSNSVMKLIDANRLIQTLKDLEWITDSSYNETNALEDIINQEPVVEERETGHWVDDITDGYYANCSCCGYQIDTHYERGYLNFCPNCGADMRG